jgi:hypothetical protein
MSDACLWLPACTRFDCCLRAASVSSKSQGHRQRRLVRRQEEGNRLPCSQSDVSFVLCLLHPSHPTVVALVLASRVV